MIFAVVVKYYLHGSKVRNGKKNNEKKNEQTKDTKTKTKPDVLPELIKDIIRVWAKKGFFVVLEQKESKR